MGYMDYYDDEAPKKEKIAKKRKEEEVKPASKSNSRNKTKKKKYDCRKLIEINDRNAIMRKKESIKIARSQRPFYENKQNIIRHIEDRHFNISETNQLIFFLNALEHVKKFILDDEFREKQEHLFEFENAKSCELTRIYEYENAGYEINAQGEKIILNYILVGYVAHFDDLIKTAYPISDTRYSFLKYDYYKRRK